ncbi:dipeptidase [Emcibacteraceae bacterium]|nr:dipeptidase [Emcibacteraceae bacterium]MDA9553465.1 dipeptidase [Emcibacteraceae bacterium]
MDRRQFLAGAAALPMMASLPNLSMAEARGKPWNGKSLIFDAMGELRDVYDNSLVEEMLEAGMRSICITLCDPKVQEQEAYDLTMEWVLKYNEFLDRKNQYYMRTTTVKDIAKARAEGKMAVFYLTQNSTHFRRDLDNVDIFYNLGLRSSQITYNHQNWAGAGCEEPNGSGLTVFGHELVEKMNDIGMLVDISHSNEATMMDTVEASKEPIIISHSCCKDLYDHPRNVPDRIMKRCADKGGVMGITQMRPFVTTDQNTQIYVNHIMHAINVMGIDHVCIGSDRDHRRLTMSEEYIAELIREEGHINPTEYPLYFEDLNGPRRMEWIWDNLAARGLSEGQLEKVMGINVYNLYEQIIG